MKHPVVYFHNGSLGDFLMVLYAFENIHAADPEAPLFVIVSKGRALCKELARPYPFVMVLDSDPLSYLFLAIKLIGKHCRVITQPTRGTIPVKVKRAARFLAHISKGTLIGFDDGEHAELYDTLLAYSVDAKLFHEVMQALVKELGYPVTIQDPVYRFEEKLETLSRYNLKKNEYIIVHPFASNEARSILGEELRNIIDAIHTHTPQLPVLISGSAYDAEKYHDLLASLPNARNLAGKISIQELAVLFAHTRLYIGPDTGTTHLAAFSHTPMVVVAHDSSPPVWLPFYNPHAKVLYSFPDTPQEVHTGKELLFSAYRTRGIQRASTSGIMHAISTFL